MLGDFVVKLDVDVLKTDDDDDDDDDGGADDEGNNDDVVFETSVITWRDEHIFFLNAQILTSHVSVTCLLLMHSHVLCPEFMFAEAQTPRKHRKQNHKFLI